MASVILAGFILIFNGGVASACPPAGADVAAYAEHMAADLCSINTSVKLISYAAIGLVLIKVVELVMSFTKKDK